MGQGKEVHGTSDDNYNYYGTEYDDDGAPEYDDHEFNVDYDDYLAADHHDGAAVDIDYINLVAARVNYEYHSAIKHYYDSVDYYNQAVIDDYYQAIDDYHAAIKQYFSAKHDSAD